MRILHQLQRAENLLLSAPISIPCNKGKKSMYAYVFRMSHACTLMSSVCHLYVLVCHPYVTRMCFYHELKKRAKNKFTIIGTKHIQNVIKLKQNFLNNLSKKNFFHFSVGYCQFHLRMLSKIEIILVSIDEWHLLIYDFY